jgi:fumarate reductase subunit D
MPLERNTNRGLSVLYVNQYGREQLASSTSVFVQVIYHPITSLTLVLFVYFNLFADFGRVGHVMMDVIHHLCENADLADSGKVG